MVQKNNKYIFLLKNINISDIDKTYNIVSFESNISEKDVPEHITKISDLSNNSKNKTQDIISFLDESKKEHNCMVSMIDIHNNKPVNNRIQKYNCFWDRYPIPLDIHPIGCPIKYVNHNIIKTYFSEISKDSYTIKEDISNRKLQEIKKDKNITSNPNIKIVENGYYLTDGCFCSFNCALSYILDNKHNIMYEDSTYLLLKMYNEMYNKKITTIIPAPSFRVLSISGGNVDIKDFRNNFNKIEYSMHGTVIPKCKSLGYLYESSYKF